MYLYGKANCFDWHEPWRLLAFARVHCIIQFRSSAIKNWNKRRATRSEPLQARTSRTSDIFLTKNSYEEWKKKRKGKRERESERKWKLEREKIEKFRGWETWRNNEYRHRNMHTFIRRFILLSFFLFSWSTYPRLRSLYTYVLLYRYNRSFFRPVCCPWRDPLSSYFQPCIQFPQPSIVPFFFFLFEIPFSNAWIRIPLHENKVGKVFLL